MNDFEKKQFFGFSWSDVPEWPLLPSAILYLDRNMPENVAHTLRTLESIPVTRQQATQIIVEGKGVNQLYLEQIDKIRYFGAAVSSVIRAVRKKEPLTLKRILGLHSCISQGLGIQSGVFRANSIAIGGTTWRPAPPDVLQKSWEAGFTALQTLQSPEERALVLWGLITRNQFFQDCNKRTATLAANWLLLPHDLCPLSFQGDHEEFNDALLTFYEKGNLDPIIQWFYHRAFEIAQSYSEKLIERPRELGCYVGKIAEVNAETHHVFQRVDDSLICHSSDTWSEKPAMGDWWKIVYGHAGEKVLLQLLAEQEH